MSSPIASGQKVAEIAKLWLGTPYHHMGRIKGVGVDCAMLPAEVYSAVGLIPRFEVGYYPMDWAQHRNEERFMGQVLEYAHKVEEPLHGDLVLFRIGRVFNHSGIVVSWPQIIHAVQAPRNSGSVIRDDAVMGRLRKFPRAYFSLWGRPWAS